jgi:hypothetical protein
MKFRTPLNAISMGLQLLHDEIACVAGLHPGEDSQTSIRIRIHAYGCVETDGGSLDDKLRGWLDLSETS